MSGLRISCCNPYSRLIQIHVSILLHKSELPSPHELHKGVHPHTKLLHTRSLQWAVPSEMSLTIECLGANGDAE